MEFKFFSLKAKSPILFHSMLILKREYDIEVYRSVQRPEVPFACFYGLFPTFQRHFSCLFVWPLRVIKIDHLFDNLLSFSHAPNPMSFAQIRNLSLQIIKSLLHLAFGLRRSLLCIDKPNIQAAKRSFKLNIGFV
jgi:hypothetical protein